MWGRINKNKKKPKEQKGKLLKSKPKLRPRQKGKKRHWALQAGSAGQVLPWSGPQAWLCRNRFQWLKKRQLDQIQPHLTLPSTTRCYLKLPEPWSSPRYVAPPAWQTALPIMLLLSPEVLELSWLLYPMSNILYLMHFNFSGFFLKVLGAKAYYFLFFISENSRIQE